MASVGAKALVVADDTDVFAMLCHFVHTGDISQNVYMVSPAASRCDVVDINATVTKNEDIMADMLAAHCLSGCDTVAGFYNIGKQTVINVLKSGTSPLSELSNPNSSTDAVLEQASKFMMSCYVRDGGSNFTDMKTARHFLWAKKLGKCTTAIPQLCSLPPTMESLQENVKRAQLQLAIWLSALLDSPPALDPAQYGWCKEEGCKAWQPVTVAEGVRLAPEELLKLIKCSCSADAPCGTKRCSCNRAGMPCTEFCECSNCDGSCHNPLSAVFNDQ